MYERSITREHRTAFVILIDQSGSMAERVDYEGRTTTKAEAVALVTNQIIAELMERAHRHDGVRDYYDIAVVGYSGDGVRSLLSDDANPFISITELAQREVKSHKEVVERIAPDGSRVPYEVSTPMWIEPAASGETPMHEALCYIYDYIKEWCSKSGHADSFPPMVFNITDGESSDCSSSDMLSISRKIRSLSTNDGDVFLINTHIASVSHQESIIFPTLEEVQRCTSRYAKDLSHASSTMPRVFNDAICEIKGIKGERDFIGVSYNASIAELITVLNIGTISIKRG